jgi:hypothetical protein
MDIQWYSGWETGGHNEASLGSGRSMRLRMGEFETYLPAVTRGILIQCSLHVISAVKFTLLCS